MIRESSERWWHYVNAHNHDDERAEATWKKYSRFIEFWEMCRRRKVGMQEVADELRVHRRTVRRMAKILERAGFIVIIQKSKNRAAIYRRRKSGDV